MQPAYQWFVCGSHHFVSIFWYILNLQSKLQHDVCLGNRALVSKQDEIGENRPRQILFFNAFVKRLDLRRSRNCLECTSQTRPTTSSGACKRGRARFPAAMFIMQENHKIFRNPNFGNGDNFLNKAAIMLYPRCVCQESWLLQYMSITAWSTHAKVVN